MIGHASRSALLFMITSAIALSSIMAAPAPARAGGMSYTGTFLVDNYIQFESFNVTTTSDLTIETWSYAGGTNFAGTVIPAGGFDPIVTLFDSSGNLLGVNDDGVGVATDPVTGKAFDSLLTVSGLAPGTYSVALTQFDNFANGLNLADGFIEDGNQNQNFTLKFSNGHPGYFWDYSGHERTGNWAMDIVTTSSSIIPEPSSLLLGGIGSLAGLGLVWKRQARPAA